MLSGEDVLGCASFEDSIGVNGWHEEQHVAGDVIFKVPADSGIHAASTNCPIACWCPQGNRQPA